MTSELIKSVRLAEKIATAEEQLSVLRDNAMPRRILDDQRTRVGALYAEVIHDITAEKILPQAREVVRRENLRNEALEKTLLGAIINAVSNEEQLAAGGSGWMESGESITNPQAKMHWEKFAKAMERCETLDALGELCQLLFIAKWDLVDCELPPAPPPYRF
jgi:hypothetical protein